MLHLWIEIEAAIFE